MSITYGREPSEWESIVKRDFTPHFEEMARILKRHDLLIWLRPSIKEHRVLGKWTDEEVDKINLFLQACEKFKVHFSQRR